MLVQLNSVLAMYNSYECVMYTYYHYIYVSCVTFIGLYIAIYIMLLSENICFWFFKVKLNFYTLTEFESLATKI